jgi:hypothetical protein
MNGAFAIGNELVFNTAVRREYLKLPKDLAALARSFRIELPPRLQRDAAILAFAIECADRLLDGIREGARRAAFGAAVVSELRGEVSFNPDVTLELAGRLAALREVAERNAVHPQFCAIVRELLSNSERMRTTRDCARFVSCAVTEGRLMVEMLLLILAQVSTPRFDSFMRQLSEPANLIDKLRDARADFRRGEISLKPTLCFRMRLMYELLKRVVALIRGSNARLLA